MQERREIERIEAIGDRGEKDRERDVILTYIPVGAYL